MSSRFARRTAKTLGLFGVATVVLLTVTSAQAAGTASSASHFTGPSPFIKADSATTGVFVLGVTDAAAGNLTDFDVRFTTVTSFSSGDIAVDKTAAGCTDPAIPSESLEAGCDGVALWRDNGTVEDRWDPQDDAVTSGFTFPGGNDCTNALAPCDVDLILAGGDVPFGPLPTAGEGTGTFILTIRTSSSIANADRFTVSLQPTSITTSPAPTVCCTGTSTLTIEADTIAPAAPAVAQVGLQRGAGTVHHDSDDVSNEGSNAVLQVYTSASDTCSPATFFEESDSTDLTAGNNRDIPGFDAATLKTFPEGQFVCYRIKDRAENFSSMVSDGAMPGQPTPAQLAQLATSNVTGAKQINAVAGAVERFRAHIKPGNTGDFVRARNGSTLSHDLWVEIVTSAGAVTCSLDPGTTNCTSDIRRYSDDGTAGPTLAEGDGIGYSIATSTGNDGTPIADGVVPAAPAGAETNLLHVSAASGHQRLIHDGGTPGAVFGLYIDTSGLGTSFRRAVDQTGAFVKLTTAAGSTSSGTSEIRSETGGGTQLDSNDNIAYVGVSSEGNVSATTAEGAIPNARAASEFALSDALDRFTWSPTGGVFPAGTVTRAFAGASAAVAYGTGSPLAEASSATPSPAIADQAGGAGVFYSTVTTNNGHESPLVSDGTIPVAPVAGDLALLGTSAANGHQRISGAQDLTSRTFGLYLDPAGGTAFVKGVTSSGGSTQVQITTSTGGSSTSQGTPGAQSIFAGTTQLAGGHKAGYSLLDSTSGNDSDIVADGVIPAAPLSNSGRVSDAANTFRYADATPTLRGRVHFGAAADSEALAYSQTGPDGEASGSATVALGADPADGASVYYTVFDSSNGNESATVGDGVLPTAPGSAGTFLSVSAAQFNQRLIADADASQPRIFRLFVDPPGDPVQWEGAVTSSNGATPVQVTTSSSPQSSSTITIYSGTAEMTTGWQVAYALVNSNDHDSEVESEGEIPDPLQVANAVGRASIDEVEVTVPANHTAKLFVSTSSDMNTAYDEGVDASITTTDPTVGVNLSGGDNLFYTHVSTLSGHESIIVSDGLIPQPIAASATQASDALDRFVATGASAAYPVKVLIDASSDAATAYAGPDFSRTITSSPDNVGADIPADFLYYYVFDAAAAATPGGGNESPITSVDQIPGLPDVAGLMSASAALQSITSGSDSSPGRILRLYIDPDGAGAIGFLRASTAANGTTPVQVTTASGEVTGASGIFAGADALTTGHVVAYSRVLGPNGQNDSDYMFDGDIPVAPADNFTADAAANASTIDGAAPTGTFRVFRNAGSGFTAVSVKRSHTNPTPTTVSYLTPNAFAAGNAVGYAQSNANGNESLVLSDSIIPNIATPDLKASSDSGTSNSDNITSVVAPVFDVAADSGASVTLLEGGTTLGNAVATSGVATITSSALSQATHAITAKASQNGNTSPVSPALSVTVDTTAPAPPVSPPDLQALSDSGRSGDANASTDNLTNIQMPVLDVTGIANGVVTLYEGATVLGSAPTNGSGLGSITASTLADGDRVLKATTTDAAGNESALTSGSLTVTIDTIAPAVPSSPDLQAASDSNIDTDNVTNDADPAFDVAGAVADSRITMLADSVAGNTADSAGGGTVSITQPLTGEGAHAITATSTDRAANVSAASPALNVTLDTTVPPEPAAPALLAADDSGSSSTDRITSDATPRLGASGETPATIRLVEGATELGNASTDGSGNATIQSSSLADGVHNVAVRQLDLAGNVSPNSPETAVTIDTIAPATPTAAPDLDAASDSGASTTDNLTNDNTPSFATSTSEASSTVTLRSDGTATGSVQSADGSGNATMTAATLADGTRSITFTSTDVAGNTSAASPALSVRIDTLKPAIPALPDLLATSDSGRSDTDNVTNDNTPSVAISGTESGVAVRLLTGTTELATGTADGTGAVTLTTPALADASRPMTAEAKDAAGNIADLSAALTVIIDTLKPAAPSAPDLKAASDSGSSATDNITNDATPAFAVASEANALVTLLDDALSVGTVIADGTGAGAVTSNAVGDGSHSFRLTSTDLAGNGSDPSAILVVLIDTAAPTATLTPTVSLFGASKAVFSEDIGSVASGQLVTRLDGSSTALGATTGYNASTKTATVFIRQPLIAGQRYELALIPGTTSPADVAGNVVAGQVRDFRASRIEQEFSPGVKHGWRIIGSSNAFGGSYGTERAAGARAKFSFTGSQVTWYTVVSRGQGRAQVLIDGVSKGIFSNYGSTTQFRVPRTFGGLDPNKLHTITIIVLGQKGSTAGTDTQVAVDAFTVRTPSGANVLHASPLLVYEWRLVSSSLASGGRYITSDQQGSAVSFTFRGRGVAWLAHVGTTMGRAQVYIDGVSKGTVDLFFTRNGQATKYFGGLSDSVHTIRIVALGTRNTRSAGTHVTVDRFTVD